MYLVDLLILDMYRGHCSGRSGIGIAGDVVDASHVWNDSCRNATPGTDVLGHLKRRPEKNVKSRVSSMPQTFGTTRASSSQKRHKKTLLFLVFFSYLKLCSVS